MGNTGIIYDKLRSTSCNLHIESSRPSTSWEMRPWKPIRSWVAVKELELSYHTGYTYIYISMYIYIYLAINLVSPICFLHYSN